MKSWYNDAMLKLDNSLLEELGLGTLPEEQKKAMLQHIYETLELRVGTQLANQMTDAQLEEFERFIDAGGDQNQVTAAKNTILYAIIGIVVAVLAYAAVRFVTTALLTSSTT